MAERQHRGTKHDNKEISSKHKINRGWGLPHQPRPSLQSFHHLLRMTVDIHCQVLKLHESPASLKQNNEGAQDFSTVLYFIFCLKKSIINQNRTANRRSSDKPDIYF